MSNESWTKGPWVATKTRGGKGKVETVQGFSVCNIGAGSYAQQEIDAHLIAAAPDLYEALKDLGDLMMAGAFPEDYYDQVVVPLLAKARGEKS